MSLQAKGLAFQQFGNRPVIETMAAGVKRALIFLILAIRGVSVGRQRKASLPQSVC
jgi:hypothetical protein